MSAIRVSCVGLLILAAFTTANAGPPQAPAKEAVKPDKDRVLEEIRSFKPVAKTKDAELNKLLVERYNAALAILEDTTRLFRQGEMGVEAVFYDMDRLGTARLDLSDDPADRIATYQILLGSAKGIEQATSALYLKGEKPRYEVLRATYHRMEIEIALLKETRKLPAK